MVCFGDHNRILAYLENRQKRRYSSVSSMIRAWPRFDKRHNHERRLALAACLERLIFADDLDTARTFFHVNSVPNGRLDWMNGSLWGRSIESQDALADNPVNRRWR